MQLLGGPNYNNQPLASFSKKILDILCKVKTDEMEVGIELPVC